MVFLMLYIVSVMFLLLYIVAGVFSSSEALRASSSRALAGLVDLAREGRLRGTLRAPARARNSACTELNGVHLKFPRVPPKTWEIMKTHGFSLKTNEKQWIFMSSQVFGGNLGNLR